MPTVWSRFLVNSFKVNANIDFLEKPAKDWLKEQSYISLKTALKDLQVTNDAAEQFVLLAI